MWKKYSSLDEYNDYAKLYGHVWGVSKFPKERDKEYSLLNYQYIQSLDLNDENIAELTDYTEDWLRKICSGDELYTKLFCYGVGIEEQNTDAALAHTDTGFLQALCVDFDLFEDDYIKNKVFQLVQKKIDEAKIGRLWVRGNYQTMIADPFALAQHALGLEVTGLLPKDCHYSKFWVERGVEKIDCMRSPMVDASEHKVSSVICNDEISYWYKYLYSGIVMNIWGLDTISHSDADFDGDIVFSTDNRTIIDNIYPNRLPITYDKESAPAQRMTTSNVIKTDLNTFDCKIGQTTNYSTKFFSMLCNYDRDSREYKELTDRIKMLRRYIGDSIDAGKGIKTKPFPAEWKSWKRVPDDWSEEQKTEQWFLNNLVEKRKPYFFVYIYDTVMEEYKKEKKRLDRECKSIFGINFNELKSKEEKTVEEKNFVKKYYNELPVTKTPCIMNKMAWRIEDLEFDFKYQKNTDKQNLLLSEKMLSGRTTFTKAKKDFIRGQYKLWKGLVKQKYQRISNDIIRQEDDDEFFDDPVVEQIFRNLEEKIPNKCELADYLVDLAYVEQKTEAKSFCWRFGSDGIIQNIMLKNCDKPLRIPVEDIDGELYLGDRYRLGDVW